MPLDAWTVAAACMSRDLTPAETRAVHALLVSQVPTPDALNAGQAQRAFTAAINAVLSAGNRFNTVDSDDGKP